MNVLALGADWSARPIAGTRIKQYLNHDLGITEKNPLSFVLRYAWFNGQGLSYLTKAEYDNHTAAGVKCFLIFQKTTTDPNGGYARGKAFGVEAVAQAEIIGYKAGDPIFFTADAPIGSYVLSTAAEFFRGATEVVRAAGYKGGVYGFRDVVWYCQDHGVGDVYWMCGAESGVRPGIHLYQWNNGRIFPDGVEADLVKQFEPIEEDIMTAEERAILDEMAGNIRRINAFLSITADSPVNPADGEQETLFDAVWQSAAEEKQRDSKNLQTMLDKLNSLGTGAGGTLTKADLHEVFRAELRTMTLVSRPTFTDGQ